MCKLTITDKDINIVVDNIKEYIKYIEKLTNIIWKIIPNYEDYIISEYGDIINVKSKKILQPYMNKFGYYQIILYKDIIKKTFRIHRLVYSIFMNDKDIKGFDIHHRDENKLNNHYSNLQKMTRSDHTKCHSSLKTKEYLKQCKRYYNLKYKENLSTEEISKKYNISKTTINYDIRQYKTHLFNNKDIDKYNNFNTKEKQDFYNNIILKEDKREKTKEYLNFCEQIYIDKIFNNLTDKELAKKYNTTKNIINIKIKDYKIFIFILDKDFEKFYKLYYKEKYNLRKQTTVINKEKNLKEYLEKAEEIYNRKYKENLTNKQLAKIYNISKYIIPFMIKDHEIFIFILDKNFDKFCKLSKKEKNQLRKKTTILKRNNNILDLGKQIEDLKLSGISNKDIAKKLNLSINRISDIYKKYKKLINDKEIKDELKSIKDLINKKNTINNKDNINMI